MRLSKGSISTAARQYSMDKFKKLVESAETNKKRTGSLVYEALFSGESESLKTLLEGWYSERDSFYLCIPGIPNSEEKIFMDTTKRIPLDGHVRYLPKTAATLTLNLAVMNYNEKCKIINEIKDKRGAFIFDMQRFANQFTTLERLAKHNEEFASYFVGSDKAIATNLPAITCEQILEKYPEITVACKA